MFEDSILDAAEQALDEASTEAPSAEGSDMAAQASQEKPVLGIVSGELDEFYPDMQRQSFKIGEKTIHVETGRLARSASASILLQCEETVLFVAATGSAEPRPGIDFFPLLIDFEEKMYSVGRLPGGYLKREGRPSDKAILSARLIDRPIRPLFPDGYRNDVQVVTNPVAMDGVHPPDVLAILGASLALTLAKNVPFLGPLGAVRVARIDGQWLANPTFEQMEVSNLDLVVAGTESSIMMVEAGADFVSESDLIDALEFAHSEIKQQVAFQHEFAKLCGVEKEPFVADFDPSPMVQFIEEKAYDRLNTAYHEFDRDKRKEQLAEIKESVKAELEGLGEEHELNKMVEEQVTNVFGESFKSVEKKVMRRMVIEEGVRADGRKKDEIRPIKTHASVLPRVHGSAVFTRGSTQALSICTLGAPGDAQRLDGVDPATEKRWMHHYAFPSYSVGEVRPTRGPGRREIGHGSLAERAVAPALPDEKDFPYAIRVNSEIMESNGSTSMASTCGASLALMDAGVPMKTPIGGIAMGLIKEGDQAVVLSDIQGLEDFLGDMDFKVTGNEEGVTALQMDIKIQGISIDLMRTALEQARVGRLHILSKMAEALEKPRADLSPYAPRIITVQIDPDSIGTVIGPGGKMIRSIVEETGAQIDIEDDGTVLITATLGEGGLKAQKIIEDLTRKIEPGQMFKGKVVSSIPIGAFVQLAPGRDGMIHISQFPYRVNTIDEVVSAGDEVLVRVVDVDDKGRISLTMRGVTDEQRAEFGLEPFPIPEDAVMHQPGSGGRDRGPRRDGGGGYRGGGGGRGPRRDGGGGRRDGGGGGYRGGGGGGGRDRY